MSTVLIDLLVDAASVLPDVDEAQWLADNGLLELLVDVMPDGGVYGEFARSDRVMCWDACNGITRTHRGGWCPFVAEHADFDCACGDIDFDYADLADDTPFGYALTSVATPTDDIEPF